MPNKPTNTTQIIHTFANRLGALVIKSQDQYSITLMANDDYYPQASWETDSEEEMMSILEDIKIFPTD